MHEVVPLSQPETFMFSLDWTAAKVKGAVEKSDILKGLQGVMEHFNLNQLFTQQMNMCQGTYTFVGFISQGKELQVCAGFRRI